MERNLWERLITAVTRSSLTVDSNDVSQISEPADNAEASITFAALGAGFRWVLVRAGGYYTSGPSAQLMSVESPSATALARVPMGTTALDLREINGVVGADNAELVIRLPAGGVLVGGRLSATAQKARVQAV